MSLALEHLLFREHARFYILVRLYVRSWTATFLGVSCVERIAAYPRMSRDKWDSIDRSQTVDRRLNKTKEALMRYMDIPV